MEFLSFFIIKEFFYTSSVALTDQDFYIFKNTNLTNMSLGLFLLASLIFLFAFYEAIQNFDFKSFFFYNKKNIESTIQTFAPVLTFAITLSILITKNFII